jgi:hypothetical protein
MTFLRRGFCGGVAFEYFGQEEAGGLFKARMLRQRAGVGKGWHHGFDIV